MTEQECLDKMAPPGKVKIGKYGNGVIQILVTSACDLGCFSCTQFSNLSRGKPEFMSPEHFEQAVISLKDYHGVVGVFGGNPALSPHFSAYCEILHKHIPFIRRGLWSNHPRGNGQVMRETFNPAVSNLNCHLVREAYDEFKKDWPESQPFGHDKDCRHAPAGNVAMKDMDGMYVDGEYDYATAYELISNCDINQNWSAGIGVFRGKLRAWFCEIAMAQAIYHQYEPDYPNTGLDPTKLYDRNFVTEPPNPQYKWWQLQMGHFIHQVDKHCHECSVPLRGYGELSQSETGTEQVSKTHAAGFKPKKKGRPVQIVDSLVQLGTGKINRLTDYMGNGKI